MKTAAVIMPVTHSRIADFVTLTKPRLNSLVVVTAGLGYYVGAGGQIEASMLFHTVVGAALVAGGAAAFNQVAERDLDELMVRTRQRPLPVGRLLPTEARLFAFVLSAIGIFQLAYVTSWIAAFVLSLIHI